MILNNYMPPETRKRQKVYMHLGYAVTNFWTNMYCTRTKLWKIKIPKTFCRTQSRNFACQSLESFTGEFYNMENKILNFQFGPLCAKQTCPNYSVGSDQDEAEIQYDRWITQEWCNCEKFENMSTS